MATRRSSPPAAWPISKRSSLLNDAQDALCHMHWITLYVALPEAQGNPSSRSELAIDLPIASSVSKYLRYPIIRVGTTGELEFATSPFAAVPEIPIAEDRYPGPGKHQIGTSRKRRVMKPIAPAQLMYRRAQHALRGRARAPVAAPNL